jgi:hypothetical protein
VSCAAERLRSSVRFWSPRSRSSGTAQGHLVGGELRASALASLAFSGVNQAPGGLPFLLGIHIMDAREIERVIVPEPGTLPLAGSGLAVLALVAARRRRARR